MNIDLHDTKASAILTALSEGRRRSGSAALGMILTLVIDVDESVHHDALHAANTAAREHPCRIVTVIRRAGKSEPRLDAEIRVGEQNSMGEVIVLRLYGALRDQADSIVLPMLLPDAPVLVWWPGVGPQIPSQDKLGLLAQRRVTDAASATRPTASLRTRAQHHSPGDTDFAWTRLTPWRTLLAAALDQPFDEIVAGEVSAASGNASAELLAAWLESRLDVPVERKVSRGPGITSARLITRRGEIAITRPDGRLATLIRTDQPDRAVPLPRRRSDELLAEELRRLDPDDVYNETIQRVFGEPASAQPGGSRGGGSRGGGSRGGGSRGGGLPAAAPLTKRPAPVRKSAATRQAEVADAPHLRASPSSDGPKSEAGKKAAAATGTAKGRPSREKPTERAKGRAGKSTASKTSGARKVSRAAKDSTVGKSTAPAR